MKTYLNTFESLLKNRVSTSVIKDFQHRLLTDVETTDIKSINVNINYEKIDVKIHNTTSIFMKTDVI